MKSVPVKQLQTKLLRWYAAEKRDLPWRKTTNPYHIAVSEVMLQQTQVSRVIPKYHAWLKTFPTPRALAAASLTDVLGLWSGLGYNRRAKNLQAAAIVVVNDFAGRWPTDPVELEKLPGFGPYTAGAVAIFSANRDQTVVDTNIRRVVTRWVTGTKTITPKKLETWTKTLLPGGRANQWHHALMDLGATICVPQPKCELCPVKAQCRAYPNILSLTRPRRSGGEAFVASNRFVRGQIVKILLAKKTGLSQTKLLSQLRAQSNIVPGRATVAITELVTEGLIRRQAKRLRIAN